MKQQKNNIKNTRKNIKHETIPTDMIRGGRYVKNAEKHPIWNFIIPTIRKIKGLPCVKNAITMNILKGGDIYVKNYTHRIK